MNENENGNGTELSDDKVIDIVKQKQKRKRPDRSEALTPQYAPGDMSRMILDSINLSGFGPVDMYNENEINQRMHQFLTYCVEHDMKPTVESMALAFNTNRTQLWRWKEGVESNLPEACRNAIKKGYNIMNQLLTQTMADGKINPVAAIFLLKNNHAYKDQTDVVVTPNNPYQGKSEQELTQQYLTDMTTDEE